MLQHPLDQHDLAKQTHKKMPVEHYGRFGGNVPTPDELLNVLKEKLINK